MIQKNNVSIEDISDIENKIDIHLTHEQRVSVLREYNRVCMDRGDDWKTLLTELIKEYNKPLTI